MLTGKFCSLGGVECYQELGAKIYSKIFLFLKVQETRRKRCKRCRHPFSCNNNLIGLNKSNLARTAWRRKKQPHHSFQLRIFR
jgi:hypothetical protein